jgi:uncharacterized protein YcfJ
MQMNRLSASILAFGLAAAVGTASAQTYYDNGRDPYDNRYGNTSQGPTYAYARVLSVRPVVDGYRSSSVNSSQRCYQRQDTYAGGYRNDGYSDGYRDDGYYDRDRYYGNDGYDRGYRGSNTGRTVATVLGGVVGAVIGSQVGGGSARYATSAIGSMVGGIAGQKVYENSVRDRYPRAGTVTVCDPVPDDRYYDSYGTGGVGANAYDVTYEYAGREYTARTNYHPGDRIRVLVDVRPQ